MGDNSLVNLGKLSKPATVLIEKVSDAVGGICKPWQTVRVAKAEQEAELIRATGEIEITDLHRRATHRWLEEEAKKQANIEAITALAISNLEEDADPSKMPNDWVANFFDKSRIVSDREMQDLWGKVLAGEANQPGSFANRTVNLLGDLNKEDAAQFQTLCSVVCRVDTSLVPIIRDHRDKLYIKNGVNFDLLVNLESLGLVHFEGLAGFQVTELPNEFVVKYFEQSTKVSIAPIDGGRISVGTALFTRAGHQLANICEAKPIEGFFNYILDSWIKDGITVSRRPDEE